MQVNVTKWGNSLGLRLPKALVQQVGIKDGERVSIVVDGDRLIVEKARSAFRLADMLAGMRPDDVRSAFDWGQDAGREAIDG